MCITNNGTSFLVVQAIKALRLSFIPLFVFFVGIENAQTSSLSDCVSLLAGLPHYGEGGTGAKYSTDVMLSVFRHLIVNKNAFDSKILDDLIKSPVFVSPFAIGEVRLNDTDKHAYREFFKKIENSSSIKVDWPAVVKELKKLKGNVVETGRDSKKASDETRSIFLASKSVELPVRASAYSGIYPITHVWTTSDKTSYIALNAYHDDDEGTLFVMNLSTGAKEEIKDYEDSRDYPTDTFLETSDGRHLFAYPTDKGIIVLDLKNKNTKFSVPLRSSKYYWERIHLFEDDDGRVKILTGTNFYAVGWEKDAKDYPKFKIDITTQKAVKLDLTPTKFLNYYISKDSKTALAYGFTEGRKEFVLTDLKGRTKELARIKVPPSLAERKPFPEDLYVAPDGNTYVIFGLFKKLSEGPDRSPFDGYAVLNVATKKFDVKDAPQYFSVHGDSFFQTAEGRLIYGFRYNDEDEDIWKLAFYDLKSKKVSTFKFHYKYSEPQTLVQVGSDGVIVIAKGRQGGKLEIADEKNNSHKVIDLKELNYPDYEAAGLMSNGRISVFMSGDGGVGVHRLEVFGPVDNESEQ